MLRDGERDARDVELLEGVGADHAVADVARDGHEGDGVEVGRRDSRDEVRGARARGGDDDARAAGRASVAVRSMAGVLLVRRLDVVDLLGVVVEGIVDVEHRTAGVPEDGVHSLVYETPDQDLGSGELLHGSSYSPVEGLPALMAATILSPMAVVPITWSAGVRSSAMSTVRHPSSRTVSTAASSSSAAESMPKL